jgi:hypothetical protein
MSEDYDPETQFLYEIDFNVLIRVDFDDTLENLDKIVSQQLTNLKVSVLVDLMNRLDQPYEDVP